MAHPPLWVACSRRDTIHLAASLGIGALTFSFVEAAEAREWVQDYYATVASEECVPAGFAVNPNVSCVLPLMCHEDESIAIDRGLDGSHFFGYSLGHYYVFGMHKPGVTDVWQEFLENRERFGFSRAVAAQTGQVLGAQLMEHGLGSLRGAVGTPAQIRTLVRAYEDAGVDQLIFVSQAGRNRHEDICESLELFAREVMPEFHERAEALEAEKATRLEPAITAALARREPRRHAPADYAFHAPVLIRRQDPRHDPRHDPRQELRRGQCRPARAAPGDPPAAGSDPARSGTGGPSGATVAPAASSPSTPGPGLAISPGVPRRFRSIEWGR